MGLISKIKDLLLKEDKKSDLVKTRVICDKCSEEIDSVFRKGYDLQPTYGSKNYAYFVNKKLLCPNCYQSIELELDIKKNLNILNVKVDKGEFISKE